MTFKFDPNNKFFKDLEKFNITQYNDKVDKEWTKMLEDEVGEDQEYDEPVYSLDTETLRDAVDEHWCPIAEMICSAIFGKKISINRYKEIDSDPDYTSVWYHHMENNTECKIKFIVGNHGGGVGVAYDKNDVDIVITANNKTTNLLMGTESDWKAGITKIKKLLTAQNESKNSPICMHDYAYLVENKK